MEFSIPDNSRGNIFFCLRVSSIHWTISTVLTILLLYVKREFKQNQSFIRGLVIPFYGRVGIPRILDYPFFFCIMCSLCSYYFVLSFLLR